MRKQDQKAYLPMNNEAELQIQAHLDSKSVLLPFAAPDCVTLLGGSALPLPQLPVVQPKMAADHLPIIRLGGRTQESQPSLLLSLGCLSSGHNCHTTWCPQGAPQGQDKEIGRAPGSSLTRVVFRRGGHNTEMWSEDPPQELPGPLWSESIWLTPSLGLF